MWVLNFTRTFHKLYITHIFFYNLRNLYLPSYNIQGKSYAINSIHSWLLHPIPHPSRKMWHNWKRKRKGCRKQGLSKGKGTDTFFSYSCILSMEAVAIGNKASKIQTTIPRGYMTWDLWTDKLNDELKPSVIHAVRLMLHCAWHFAVKAKADPITLLQVGSCKKNRRLWSPFWPLILPEIHHQFCKKPFHVHTG